MTQQTVLDFWFTECTPVQWFTIDEAFDTRIRERFADTRESIVRGETVSWRATPQEIAFLKTSKGF